jgi:hypothetical protein
MTLERRRSPVEGQGADVVVAGSLGDESTVPPPNEPDALFGTVTRRTLYGSETSFVPAPEMAVAERDRGIEVVEQASDDQDRAVVDQAIREFGRMQATVSANDIRPLLPNVRPSLIGARFLALARQGKLKKAGYVPAAHAAGHGRMVAEWRWVG